MSWLSELRGLAQWKPSSWGLTYPPPAVGGLGFLQLPCSLSILPLQASAQPTFPGPTPQTLPSLASVPSPHLLLPGDFTGTQPGSETRGVYLRPVSAASTQATPGTWAPSVQPGSSQEGGQDKVYSLIAMGHANLEAELEDIQRQLQDYQTMKQNLW